MKKYLAFLILLFGGLLDAQTTTVSATVVDSDTTAWANGTWKINFLPNPSFPSISQYKLINGAALNPSVYSQNGALDGTGAFSVSVYDSSLISPAGSGWTLSVCPNATSGCGIYTFSTAGGSMNISSNLTSVIAAPRFNAVAGNYGYADIEAKITLPVGATYFDVTLQCQKIYQSGTWGCPSASGGIVNPGQAAFAQYPTILASSVSPSPSLTYDILTGTKISAPNFLPAVTPVADIRNPAYGAVCNGIFDDNPGLQAAITAAGSAGGSGTVYIPDNCHLANGSNLTTPNAALQITLNIQGTLKVDSTLVLPRGVDLVCLSKGPKPQFSTGAPTCVVNIAPVRGTLGTAITSTNTAVVVTPTYAGGSNANMVVGASITIGGTMTCGTTGATRTALAGTYPGAGPVNVVYNIGTCVDSSGNAIAFHIPPASLTTINSCSDTSFNTPTGGIFSGTSDFPGLTLGARMVGTGATLADTSCVIIAFNLDSFESTRIEAVSGNNITIRTNHTHAASDLYGMNGMAGTFNDLSHKLISGVSVSGNYGAGYWADANSMMRFEGVSFQGTQYLTSIPMILSSSWGWTFERSQTTSYSGYTCPTVSFNCGNIGPPFDVLMDLLPQSIFSENAVNGGIWGPNSTISVGMYMTSSGYSPGYITGPVLNNSVIEQPMWNGITIDNRNTGAIYQTSIEDSLIQDNLVGWSTAAWMGYTDNTSVAGVRRGTVGFYNNLNLAYGGIGLLPQTVNKYFCGEISVSGSSRYNSLVWPACPEATVTINDGRSFVGEVNSNPIGLTYIPWPTKTINIDPTTWGCTGSGCVVTSGKLAPDGSTNAGEISSAVGTFAFTQVSSGTFSTAPGDVLLYGAWSRCTDSKATGTMQFTTFGTDTFDYTSNVNYIPAVQNLFWHPSIGMSIVKVGQAGNHTIAFYLYPSATLTGSTCQFWQPFVIQVPASSGVPIDEIQRWRTEALHGYVPSNLSVGQVMALSSAVKMYFGNDTNLYRASAGVLQTDGVVNAVAGVKSGACTGYLKNDGTCGAGGGLVLNVPAWLTFLGDSSDGPNITASGNLTGVKFYTNFTVPFGNTVTVNSASGLTIHASGACVIAGTITTNATNNGVIYWGPSSGSSGGGTGAGTAGTGSNALASAALIAGPAAGGAGGGNGNNGSSLTAIQQKAVLSGGLGQDGQYIGGAPGKAGGSSGGTAGNGAPPIILICGSFTGTDGTNIGTLDGAGKVGGNAPGNNTGGGSGGAGGAVIISSHTVIPTLPTITVVGGAGGTCGGFTGCGTGGKGGDGWTANFTW